MALSAIINYFNKSTPPDPKHEVATQISKGSIHEPTHTSIDDLVKILASRIEVANKMKAKYDSLKKQNKYEFYCSI
jgi:hypothetical protein